MKLQPEKLMAYPHAFLTGKCPYLFECRDPAGGLTVDLWLNL